MNKMAQNLTWNCLPLEVKKEVKRQYQIAINAKKYYTECTLEYLFGLHNLTSDAEGEEMLTVSRKRVQELFNEYQELYGETKGKCHDKEVALSASHFYGKMCAFSDLFGSKCLPDEACNIASNVASSEPKPAEPTCTDDAPTCTDDCSSQCSSQGFDNIIKDGFSKERRLNIAAILAAGMLASEVRCYPVDRALELADALIAEAQKGGE